MNMRFSLRSSIIYLIFTCFFCINTIFGMKELKKFLMPKLKVKKNDLMGVVKDNDMLKNCNLKKRTVSEKKDILINSGCKQVLKSGYCGYSCQYKPILQVVSGEQKRNENEKLIISFKDFYETLKGCINVINDSYILKDNCWLSKKVPNFREKVFYVQKRVLNSKSKIILVGDRHGAIEDLEEQLFDLIQDGYIDSSLKIIKDNCYIIFLGDYVDRGLSGIQIIYTLMRLKIQNPYKVVLLRGNHENVSMNKICGFERELYNEYGLPNNKYGLPKAFLSSIMGKLYNLLPSALYVSSGALNSKEDFVLFCHGGLEPRFDPRKLLDCEESLVLQEIKNLDAKWLGEKMVKNLVAFCKSGIKPGKLWDIGFVCNDFIVGDEIKEDIMHDEKSGRMALNRDLSLKIIKKSKIKAVFTGHQHHSFFGNMMEKLIKNHGFYSAWSKKQWDGRKKSIKLDDYSPVWTLIASPGSYRQHFDYDFDVYAILHLGKSFEEWVLEPKKIEFDYA